MNKNYFKVSSKIHSNKTIFFISDLHYYYPKDLKKLRFILKKIKKEVPDYLIIGGDLLDGSDATNKDLFVHFIKECALNTIVLIGIGNHDITFVEKKKAVFDQNKSFWDTLAQIKNVFVLDNTIYETDDLFIEGITLPYHYYYKTIDSKVFFNQNLSNTNSQKLKILLIHDPISIINYDVTNYDIVLAGHTHNGMVPKVLEPIMKHKGLISPDKKLFPKYVRGRFQIKNTDIIVSGGITKLSKRSKLNGFDCFWNHELTIITLKPE